jgi:hypothetical protein
MDDGRASRGCVLGDVMIQCVRFEVGGAVDIWLADRVSPVPLPHCPRQERVSDLSDSRRTLIIPLAG